MAETSVIVEVTRNLVAIEGTQNSTLLETFDVWTDYYFLLASQILAEHKEG